MKENTTYAAVAAVIVTYNRVNLLVECIESLLKQTIRDDLQILVIDNASTDGTAQIIKPYVEISNIKYFNTGTNLGGAGGFEFGVRQAVKENCKYIWLMDDDCIPNPDTAEQFLNVGNRLGNYGFLSSYVKWTDGTTCTMNVQRKDIARKLSKFEGEIIRVQIATFVSLFVPKKVILSVGAPIGDFFIWGDDWEYSRRISMNYPSYVVMSSIVTHKTFHNKGCDISNDTEDRIERYRYSFRNDIYLMRREGLKGHIYWILKVSKNVVKVIINKNSYKMARLKVIFSGIKEGYSFKPEIKPFDV